MTKDELAQTLLNKHWVGEQMRKFRERKFADIDDLEAVTQRTSLGLMEKGKSFPSWENIVLIVLACEADFVDLFSEIDSQSNHNPKSHRPSRNDQTEDEKTLLK